MLNIIFWFSELLILKPSSNGEETDEARHFDGENPLENKEIWEMDVPETL